MPRRLGATLLTGLTLLAAPGARAGDQPATTPTRDVDITYRLAGPQGAAPAEQRVRWQVATGRQRIDPPTSGLHIIVDTRAHRLASVRDAERLAMEVDEGPVHPLAGTTAAHYVRRGDQSVAGMACAEWQAGGAADAPLLCFTEDGVLLRVAAAGRVVAEAVHVTFAPSNPADFEIPPDYRRIVRDRAAPEAPPPKGSTP